MSTALIPDRLFGEFDSTLIQTLLPLSFSYSSALRPMCSVIGAFTGTVVHTSGSPSFFLPVFFTVMHVGGSEAAPLIQTLDVVSSLEPDCVDLRYLARLVSLLGTIRLGRFESTETTTQTR